MKQVTIYTLSDPDTGEVRYVGKANNATNRLKSHLRDSLTRNSPLYSWVRKLTAKGKSPTMQVLRVVDETDWCEAERDAIACYRIAGGLLNVVDGGDEPYCSPEVRSANGAKMNSRLTHLKREITKAVKDKTRSPEKLEQWKVAMRYCAGKRPDLFPKWVGV
jgi:hypothetical protein